MEYKQSTPLLRHQLDSILPYEVKPYESKHFLKTKEFYKPQVFIWNNPHRTSNTIYKFYHKYNQDYEKNKALITQKIESQQKEQTDLQRIRKLSELRKQTRHRFYTKQKERENLECLSGIREKTQNQENFTTVSKRFSTVLHYHSKPSKYEPMIPSHWQSKIPRRKSSILVEKIEKTYLTSLQKTDLKNKLIQKLIISETHRHQNQIRSEFEKQKEINSKRGSQITKIEVSQLDTKSIYKQL